MMNVHATLVSLVLTVLLTIGCTHLVFSDKGVVTSHEEHELAVTGTRRAQRATTPAPEPLPVPERAAGAGSPRSSDWVSVPTQANATANASTPAPMPPPGPAPAWHSRGTAGATNRSRPESAGRAGAV